MSARPGFTHRPFPREREIVLDFMRLGERKHLIHGLVEMDVTDARARLREGGERLSFTAYMVASLARAVAETPIVQAHRDWRGRLAIYDDVDVVTLIDVHRGEWTFPLEEEPSDVLAVQRTSFHDVPSAGSWI